MSAAVDLWSCANCGKHVELKHCPCRKAAYCNADCQKQHRNVHKYVCVVCRDFEVGSAQAAHTDAARDAVLDMLSKIGMPFTMLTAAQVDDIKNGKDAFPPPVDASGFGPKPRCFEGAEQPSIPHDVRHRWMAIAEDLTRWCAENTKHGLHYAVVFEKKGIMELPITKVMPQDVMPHCGMRWPEKNFGTSELRHNPNLMLVSFSMAGYSMEQYEEQVYQIDWTKVPTARMIVSVEKQKWAARLLSTE